MCVGSHSSALALPPRFHLRSSDIRISLEHWALVPKRYAALHNTARQEKQGLLKPHCEIIWKFNEWFLNRGVSKWDYYFGRSTWATVWIMEMWWEGDMWWNRWWSYTLEWHGDKTDKFKRYLRRINRTCYSWISGVTGWEIMESRMMPKFLLSDYAESSKRDWGKVMKSVSSILSLRYLWFKQAELSSRQFDMELNFSGRKTIQKEDHSERNKYNSLRWYVEKGAHTKPL